MLKAQRYSFYNLGVENGLIQSQVRSLAQDSFGHLWIGTLGGLSRYDGSSFTNLTVRNGMLDNNSAAIGIGKDGRIWIGGPEGISVYNGRQFEHFRLQQPENHISTSVKGVYRGSGNTMWCHTDSGIYAVLGKSIRKTDIPATAAISCIYPENDTIWIGTRNGVIYKHYNNKTDSFFFDIPGNKRLPLFTTHILRDSRNRLLLVTRSGLFTLENDSTRLFKVNNKAIVNIPLVSVTEDRSGALWLGSISGVYRVTDSTIDRYGKKNGFTDNAVIALLTDKEGSVWLGTDGQGVYRFSGAQFSILDEMSNLPGEQVMSFAPTPSGKLYIGTSDAGLYFYDRQNITPVTLQFKNPYISALYAGGEYDIWIGTQGRGLCRLKGNERIYYTVPELSAGSTIFSFYRDDSATLWMGTSEGIVTFRRNKFSKVKGLNQSIFSFAAIGRDSLLVAAANGLYLFHNSTVAPFITGTVADSSNPMCMTLHNGKLWIGTNDNGVLCYDLQSRTCFTLNKSNGLQSDFIYNILADKHGDIWAGTGYGIHRIRFGQGLPSVTFYGREEGITGMESNHNASCLMPDGTLWFGTTKGAVHIDPDKKLLLPAPTSIVLQSVKVFGDELRDTSYFDSLDNWYNVPYMLRLPHKKNNITFTFKGITLGGNEQLVYRYHMEGIDAPWSEWTSLNSVTYSALPPGRYRLEIESKTINSSEVKALSYSFEIITPIHKTTWFSLAVLAACILAGVSIQYILNRRKQNRLALVEKLRREEQAKVRMRTAEDFHDEVGNKLTRINVLTTVLKEKLGDMTPDKQRLLDQIQDNTAQLYSGTRDILWSLQSTNDSLYEILHRIRDFGRDLFADTPIEFEFTGTDTEWHNYRLPLDMSRNLIMIFKEALNNCLKYARATKVHMDAELRADGTLHITLSDNGKGFNVEEVVKGNGLNNMRNRTERLKGKLYIDSREGTGTAINLHFRLPGKN